MMNHRIEVENAIAALGKKEERLIHLMEIEGAIARLRTASHQHDERLEELRQQFEAVLGILESQFLGALTSGSWAEFDQFVEGFKAECTTMTEGQGADELPTPSATTYPTTDKQS